MYILSILAVAAVVGYIAMILASRPLAGVAARFRLLDWAGDLGEIALLDRTAALKGDLQDTLKAARAITVKAEDEGRDAFTDAERAEINDLMAKAAELKAAIAKREGDDQLKAALAEFGDPADLGPASGEPTTAQSRRGKSTGQRFTEHPAFRGWLKNFPGGIIPDQAKGIQSPPVSFGGLKDLITGTSGDSSAGAFLRTDYTDIVEMLGRRPFMLRSVISNRTTTSDLVHYVRQATQSNAAAVVPEASTADAIDGTTVTNADGGLKPESGMAFEPVTEPVKTIAVWAPATKKALSDVAQLRGIIDDELSADIEQEIEDQVVSGSGTGENFTGILNTTGIQTQAFSTNIFESVRKAKTKAWTVGRVRPNGVALNPADEETIDLAQDAQDRYYGNGPFSMGPATLWGMPRVVTEAVPAGTAIVGDWSKAVLWDREQTMISVSDSHADFFIRNLVAVLAEARLAFGVTRPKAFVSVDLTA